MAKHLKPHEVLISHKTGAKQVVLRDAFLAGKFGPGWKIEAEPKNPKTIHKVDEGQPPASPKSSTAGKSSAPSTDAPSETDKES